ncbi:SDR family NAD(P)-dependent oxidoreductase [Hyphomicrobium sp.]|uniref:SDR family NAD(P)-dependent oxidoreductase n=1 Tax=Hyphomicrobium sp. TaxID=82 RepID=UPI002FE41080
MNEIDLKNRVAVITGAASGIGYATAERMLKSGAHVDIWDLHQDRVEAAVSQLSTAGSCTGRSVDVSKNADVQVAAKAAIEALGRVDILVNNAGVADIAPLSETTEEVWRRNISVNLDSVFYCTRAFVSGMVERGWGRVVNVTSVAGKEGNVFQCAYSAAKGGVIAFTKTIGKELATTGVTVNAVAPTVFDTPFARAIIQANPETLQPIVAKIPMQRMGHVDEAAAMIAWIASEDCSFTTAFTFDLSGGRSTY